MIEVINVTKTYGKNKVLDNINFKVNKGEVIGFLGPNGAGKSTTMGIITGYLTATEGIVKINGLDVSKNSKIVKQQLGYMPEILPLYMDMTVMEYLKYVANLKNFSKNDIDKHVQDILKNVFIEDMKNRLIKNLSRGYKQRVGIAQALIGNPEVIILDEPTVGLDPKQIIDIRNLIKSLSKDHTVILSTHILSEVSQICEKVIIINKGKIVAIDTPKGLQEKFPSKNIVNLVVEGEEKRVVEILKGINEITNFKIISINSDKTINIEVESDKKDVEIRKILFFVFAKTTCPILEIHKSTVSFEDTFINLINQK